MPERLNESAAAERCKAQELAWLEENLSVLWPAAYTGYLEAGRGTVIIDTSTKPLTEAPPFRYAASLPLGDDENETLKLLAQYVAEYDPERQFVATFVRTGGDKPELSLFQLEVDQALADVVQAMAVANQVPLTEAALEPPDIETLLQWEAEGGCEATDGCWCEPDGTCPHGHPSWLLELGLI